MIYHPSHNEACKHLLVLRLVNPTPSSILHYKAFTLRFKLEEPTKSLGFLLKTPFCIANFERIHSKEKPKYHISRMQKTSLRHNKPPSNHPQSAQITSRQSRSLHRTIRNAKIPTKKGRSNNPFHKRQRCSQNSQLSSTPPKLANNPKSRRETAPKPRNPAIPPKTRTNPPKVIHRNADDTLLTELTRETLSSSIRPRRRQDAADDGPAAAP